MRFLPWGYLSAVGIHQQICEVYKLFVMCESKVRKLNRDFKAGRDSFGWEFLGHSHLFCYFKHHLGGNHFNDNEVVKMVENSWLSDKTASLFKEDIQNLIINHNTYLNKHGS